MRMRVKEMVEIGVVKRIIAGPVRCHLLIDIKRPYSRPRADQAPMLIEGPPA